jgi:hypothetical protein
MTLRPKRRHGLQISPRAFESKHEFEALLPSCRCHPSKPAQSRISKPSHAFAQTRNRRPRGATRA